MVYNNHLNVKIVEQKCSFYDDHEYRLWGFIGAESMLDYSDKEFVAYVYEDNTVEVEKIDDLLTEHERDLIKQKVQDIIEKN